MSSNNTKVILKKSKKVNKDAKTKSRSAKNKAEGMTYPKTSAEGHAGEYLFSYWISRYFKWPCRLLDIDMGLDAQVEIYTNEISTGLFIGVQVKTTSRKMENKLSVQIPYKNIKYWGDCDYPIVIVLVCLNEDNVMKEPSIYWQHLDKKKVSSLKIRALKNDNGCASICFNCEDYLADIADKPKWVDLWLTVDDKNIIKLAKATGLKIRQMVQSFDDDEAYRNSPDLFIPDLNSIMNDYDKINYFSQARKRLLDLVPPVKECTQNYHDNIERFLEYFNDLVKFSYGNYNIQDDFNDHENINYALQQIIKEVIPRH